MDTIYRPGDEDNKILQKILVQYGGFPRPGDFDNSLYRKILTQLGGTFRPGDGTSELLRKIATRLGAGPLPGDTTNKLLYRIDQSLTTEPRPGDYDNILLRKWLSPNALVPTPGTTITIIPKVDPPHTQAEVTVNITGGDNLVGFWLGFWVIEYSNPNQNNSVNYQLKDAKFISGMPFTTTFSIPIPAVNPSTVCVALVKGPTQASVSTNPLLTKGSYKQCFTYASDFTVVNFNIPPAAPVATAATALAETSFSANWNASATATSYRLDVSTVNNFASFVTGYNNLNVGNVLTQSVTGLTGGTTYYFRVRAVNATGTSPNSNIITSLTIPAAPVATAASGMTDAFFTANWNASMGASDYRLDVSTVNNFASFVTGYNDTSVGNVTNASVAGLAAGTTYYFRVRATNASGASANSNTISTITIPAAPTATAASNVVDVSFDANWNAQTGATGYRLDVSTANDFSSFVSGFNDLDVSNVTTYSVTGLTQLTTYYYRVRAYNGSGTSGNSNVITQATVATVPSAPTATAATSVIDVSFSANWGAVTGATGYELDVATDAGFTSFVSGFNDLDVSNVTTYSVTGLSQNTTYYFRVRAYNTGGTSGNSNTITTLTYFTETIDWVTRVVGNGGSVSQGTKDATNTFLGAVNTAGIRSLLWRVNLFASDSYAGVLVPLIKDHGGTLDVAVKTASSSPATSADWVYAENTGLHSNGASQAFLLTGFSTLDLNADINSAHFGVYVQTSANEQSLSGIQDPAAGFRSFYISHGSYNDTNVYFTHAVTVNTQYSDSGANGFFFGTRTASNLSTLYRNGVSKATNATVSANFVSATNLSIFAFSATTINSFTTKTLGGYSIGLKMDGTQQLAYYNAWQAFQTALGRNV